MNATQTQDPFANCVVFTLSQSAWRVTRKVSGADVEVYAVGEVTGTDDGSTKVDPKLATVTKKLLDKCPEYARIGKLDGAIRRDLRELCVPSGIIRGGSYLFSYASVPTVEKLVETYKAEREEAVAAFVAVYPDLVREIARKARENQGLAGLFRASDYPAPGAIAEKFTVETGYEVFGQAPEALARISADLFAREQDRIRAKIQSSVSEVQNAMRAGLLGLVDKLHERLQPGEDGARKVFRNSAVSNVTDWLALFDQRNVTNDAALADVVAKARKVMEGLDPDTLRKDENYRATVSKRLAEVSETLGGMVEKAAVRTFDWSEELDADENAEGSNANVEATDQGAEAMSQGPQPSAFDDEPDFGPPDEPDFEPPEDADFVQAFA